MVRATTSLFVTPGSAFIARVEPVYEGVAAEAEGGGLGAPLTT
jgi:hypothetical protein